MASRRPRLSERSFADQKDRLREYATWFPYVAILPFFLVMLFTSHVVFGTNPRIGNPAELLVFSEKPASPGAIWISVTPIEDNIVVTTHDRKVFRWPLTVRSVDQIEDFTNYLKKHVDEEIMSAAIAKEAFRQQTKLVIAADQRLRYRHIRPILYAMAQARITNYEFETRMPAVAENSTSDDESVE